MELFKPNLTKLTKKRDVKGLFRALRYRKDANIRRAAASVLGAMKDPRAIQPLAEALNDLAYGVRVTAVKSLAAIDDTRVVEPLIQALGDDHNDVRYAATESLVTIGQPAVDPLIQALKDQSRMIRETAAYLLFTLRMLGITDAERAESNLIAALRDQYSGVRKAAAVALCAIGSAQAVGPLIQMLQSPSAELRVAAAKALGFIGGEQGTEALIMALKDKNTEVRKAIARALGTNGGEQAVAPLVQTLTDHEKEVRGAAKDALKEIGNPAVPRLEKALRKDGLVQKAAADILEALAWEPKDAQQEAYYCIAKNDWDRCVQIGVPAVEPLIGVLKDSSYRKRRDAVKALGMIHDERVEKVLIGALKDVDAEVRVAAVDALRGIGGEQTTAPVIAILKEIKQKEGAANEQIAAMKTLGVFGGEPAMEILAEMLESDIQAVRETAADTLDDLGWQPDTEERHAYYCIARSEWEQCAAIGAPAVEPLIKMPMACTNRTVIEVLGKIGDTRAVKPIQYRLESDNWEMRKTAALALLSIAEKNPDATVLNNALLKKIKTAHSDKMETWSDACTTYSKHIDTGIGLSAKQ